MQEKLRRIGTLSSPVKILFVCLGNICRSPAAQGVMQSIVDERGLGDMFVLDSAGFYGGHAGDLPDARMRAHAIRRGLRLTHISRQIRWVDYERFDILVGMDSANLSDLHDGASTLEEDSKIVSMADFCRMHPYADCVPDPYYGGAEGFENVLDLLQDACLGLLDAVMERLSAQEGK